MPWGWFKWPEYLKKKACRYLLQHYLGNYLETKISLEDLTVNLYNGTATVSNVPLSAEVICVFQTLYAKICIIITELWIDRVSMDFFLIKCD